MENPSQDEFKGFSEHNNNMFVYANYLVPGIHKFVIYCPISKRAFCKTILIDINTKDFYPEYPT